MPQQRMTEQPIHFAGFGWRLLAVIIDLIVMFPIIYLPLTYIYGPEYWDSRDVIYGTWDVILGYVLPFVATIWFWLKFKGTPGKMLLKLRVVDANSLGSLSMGQAIWRYFAYILAMIPFFLGFLIIAFDKKHQGWHDKLSKTYVIRDLSNRTE